MAASHPLPTFGSYVSIAPMRTWLVFWLFVIVSWAAVGFYLFISGWVPCTISGTCIADGAVVVLALLLMPVQVLLAVYLKRRRAD